jgi:hypothetical protein
MNDLLGLFDPYGIIIKKPKKHQTAYMKKQNEAIKNYRYWYYTVTEKGLMTTTQIKKKGLYNEQALEQGVSAMGDPLANPVEPILPILVPNIDPAQVVLPPEEVDHIEDQAQQLQAVADGNQTADGRTRFMQRRRRRMVLIDKRRMATKLASLLDPDEPGNAAVYYQTMTLNEMRDAIESATGKMEEKGEPDEEKVNEIDEAKSSDALSAVEDRMARDEMTYTRDPAQGYQAIKKGRGAAPPGAASWVALRELIRSSITDESRPHYGTLLMFSGSRTSERTTALGMVLSEIGNMPDGAQRMLDLLTAFGIDIRDTPGMVTDQAQSPANRNRITNQFRTLTPETKRKLLIAFNKLIRNLTEERIDTIRNNPKLERSPRLRAILADMTKFLSDLSTGVTESQLAGGDVAPDKPVTSGDFLDAENQQMITLFTQLMAASDYSDLEISDMLSRMSNKSEMKLAELTRDPEFTQTEAHAQVYAELVNSILIYTQTMQNTLSDRFARDSSLRNSQNIFKLKRTIQEIVEQVVRGITNARQFLSAPSLIELKRNLISFRKIVDSIRVPTTAGGVTKTRSESDSDDSLYDIDLSDDISNIPDDEMNVSIEQFMRELEQPGMDTVTVNVLGRDISLGTTAVVINWNQIPINDIRRILIEFNNTPSNRRTTVGGYYLQEQFDEQVRRSNQEELFRLADTTIKDKKRRREILNNYPDAKPRRRGRPEDPEDPDDPGRIMVAINGNWRALRLSGIVALLTVLGVGMAKIISLIKKGGKVTSKNPVSPKYPKDIGNGDNNYDDNNNLHPVIDDGMQPTFPKPNEPTSGRTDPIYGGIGTIQPRSQPFKPIQPPMLDGNLGADYIEPDANMMKNSALMKLVEKYNDDARYYNELLELKYDLSDTGETLTADEMQDMSNLSANMKNQVVAINQQAPLIGQSSNENYYQTVAVKPQLTQSFVAPTGSIDKIYPLIPTDDYTRSTGLDDDIAKYNNLAEQYNQLAAMYKGYGQDFNIVGESAPARSRRDAYVKAKSEDPGYSAALTKALALEKQIEPVLAKINGVMQNPSSSVGRNTSRTVSYTADEKSLIGKVASSDVTALNVTPEEMEQLRDNPELYGKFERLMTIYNELTDNGKNPINMRSTENPKFAEFQSLKQEFRDIRQRGYTLIPSDPRFGGRGEKAPLTTQTDWVRVQQQSQKEYMRSKQQFLDSVAALKQAQVSGAPPHKLSQLYNQLETNRLHYETSRVKYETMADNYKHSLSGRTSYLADMTDETLPNTTEEIAKFDRLQSVERVLQNNPDALKFYNEQVKAMNQGFGSTPMQSYDDRMTLLKSISGKYNLANEYEDAVNSDLHVQVQDLGEDPSTIVNFEQGGEDIGKSTERANFIDPAERELFMTEKRDRILEQKRWEDFSLVQPWNGLGTPRTNPLLDHQVQEYMTRYGNTTKVPKPTPYQMRNLPCHRDQIIRSRELQPSRSDIAFIPTIQATFGREIWEDEQSIPTNDFGTQRALFTRNDNDLPNNEWETWYPNKGSTYHPDRQIDMNNFNPAVGSMLKQNSNRRSVMYGVNPMFNEQYGSQQVSTFGGQTMNNNYGSNPSMVNGVRITPPQMKPTSLYGDLDISARRSMSMRR